jgi:uncharacterized repeat protein (TIGR01451 family)
VAAQSYNVTYTITYQNAGDANLSGVTLGATVPSGTYLLGPTAVWSSGSDGVTLTGQLGSLPAGTTTTTQLLLRTGLMNVGDTFSTTFTFPGALEGRVDTNAVDNTYLDTLTIGDTAATATRTPTVTSTATATLRPGQTPQPTATHTATTTPTPTQTPQATSVPVAPEIPSVLTNSNASVVVVVPPGAIETEGMLVYKPELTATATPTFTPTVAVGGTPRPVTNSYRALQSFTLEYEQVTRNTARDRRTGQSTRFLSPVIITMTYDDAVLAGGNALSLEIALRNADGSYTPLASTVDTTTHTVSAAATETGAYSLIIKRLSYRSPLPFLNQRLAGW